MKKINWKNVFAIDYRSLALFRMGVALCILWDCFERLKNVRDFLSDQGLIPLQLYERYRTLYPGFSIYSWNGSEYWATFLLIFTACLAIGLFWGKRFPVTIAILSWLMNVSLHHRNPFTMFGGDALLQLCLFWLMFLPLNGPTDKNEKSFSNGASIALLVQIAIIYFASGWQKVGEDWKSGQAVFYALSIGMYGTATGEWLKQFPTLLKIATFTVLYIERFVWALIFIPSRNAWARTSAFVILVGMHLSFAAGLNLYFFAWLDIALLCVLIPTELWDRLQNYRIRMPQVSLALRRSPPWLPGLALFFVVWFALLNLQVAGVLRLPKWPEKVAVMFRLHQGWQLFAPSPYHFSNWFVTEAESESGEKSIVQIRGFGGQSFARPPDVGATFPTLDWLRFYPVLMVARSAPGTVKNFGQFACRVLNKEEKRGVKKFKFYLVREMSNPNRSPASVSPSDLKMDLLLNADCNRRNFEIFSVKW